MEKNMVKKLLKFTFMFTIFMSLFSCSMTPDAGTLLDMSTLSYEKAIRWGNFDRAKSFHKEAPNLSDLERRRLKFYRVTGYSVLQNDFRNSNNAYLIVEIKYYKNDLPVIKTFTVKQHWQRDKDSTVWYLSSTFPKFR